MRVSDLKANSSNNTVSRTTRATSRFSRRSSCRAATTASITPSPSTAAIRAPTGTGCTPVAELPNTINPPTGWVFNSNDWLYSAAGAGSPSRRIFRLSRHGGRELSDDPCDAAVDAARPVEPRPPAGGGLRQRPAVVRNAGADAGLGMAGASAHRYAPCSLGRADAAMGELGQALGKSIGAQHARAILGR